MTEEQLDQATDDLARKLSLFRDRMDDFWCDADHLEQFFIENRSAILILILPLLATAKECKKDISKSQLRDFVYGMLRIENRYEEDLAEASGENMFRLYTALNQHLSNGDRVVDLRESAKQLLVYEVFQEDRPPYYEIITTACELYVIHLKQLQDDFRARIERAA